MNNFYVSIIFLGITLMAVAFVWIAYDIKRSNDDAKRLDEKKKDLAEIIADSEQMIEELNKFSDYVITQMDMKSEEMNNSLKVAEEKIKQFQSKVSGTNEADAKNEIMVNGSSMAAGTKGEDFTFSYKHEMVIDTLDGDILQYILGTEDKHKDNVIPLNSRHKEVLKLAEKGLSDTEIAKTLNMGKGEVELILGVNR